MSRSARSAGWDVTRAYDAVVRFETEAAVVEIGRLPAGLDLDASGFAEGILSTFPEGRVAPLHEGPDSVRLAFEGPPWTGFVDVRMGGPSGLFVYGRSRDGTEIQELCERILESLAPAEPMPRSAFVDPQEQSFRVALPAGWQIQHAIADRPAGRRPMARLHGGPDTFVACEADDLAVFLDRPLEEAPPSGFLASLGRMAQQLEEGMSGLKRIPFEGFGPVLEHHYVPMWQSAVPGSRYLGFEPLGPQAALARMALPDGTARLVRVEGLQMPQLGADHWGAVMTHYAQAPEDELETLFPVLMGVILSWETNPQWWQAEGARQQQANLRQMQMSQQLHQQRMAGLQAQAQASNHMYQTQNEISDIQMETWRNTQAMSDAGHHQSIHGIHETADYVGPGGQSYVAPDVDRLWRHEGGDVFVSGGPGLEMGLEWTELKKKR